MLVERPRGCFIWMGLPESGACISLCPDKPPRPPTFCQAGSESPDPRNAERQTSVSGAGDPSTRAPLSTPGVLCSCASSAVPAALRQGTRPSGPHPPAISHAAGSRQGRPGQPPAPRAVCVCGQAVGPTAGPTARRLGSNLPSSHPTGYLWNFPVTSQRFALGFLTLL